MKKKILQNNYFHNKTFVIKRYYNILVCFIIIIIHHHGKYGITKTYRLYIKTKTYHSKLILVYFIFNKYRPEPKTNEIYYNK